MIKTRVIDLTSSNVTCSEDVRVEFRECEVQAQGIMFDPLETEWTCALKVPGANMVQDVVKLEARGPLEYGYTGFSNERLAILCDLTDESIDKLIALANFICRFHKIMFRIPEDKDKPEISVVFTELPFTWVDGIPTAKSKKIAVALKWQWNMHKILDIKYTAIGDYLATIGTRSFEYNESKTYVDTCLSDDHYDGSPRAIVHTVNPLSDILYSMKKHKLIEDCDTIWISPSITSMMPQAYVEDCFDKMSVVRSTRDIELMYSPIAHSLELSPTVSPDGNIEISSKSSTMCPKHIAVFATSIHDFMTFSSEIVWYAATYLSSDEPLKLSLFINYDPEDAREQKLHNAMNSFINFIESRTQIIDPVFYVDDISAVKLVDLNKDLLKYVPENIEIYRTKILDTLC